MDDYSAAPPTPAVAGATAESEGAKQLPDCGAINQAEFEALKQRALTG